MRRLIPLTFVLCAVMTAANCTRPAVINEREVRFRCVNIPLLYDYAVAGDREAKKAREERESLQSAVERFDREIAAAEDEAGRQTAVQKKLKARDDLEKLRTAEEGHKRRLLADIRRALSLVASRLDIDYVFDNAEGLAYYRKECDVTDDVLRELAAIKRRNDPVSR